MLAKALHSSSNDGGEGWSDGAGGRPLERLTGSTVSV